jgi:pimeloyl-ACP methyl ester carboxylesterase
VSVRHAYLHGFASGPLSRKGRELARRLAADGVELHLPDLNRPSFARLTIEGSLAAVDELTGGGSEGDRSPWRFIGSSFGGYLAALWAERHPERVDRLLLLCPGFDLARRWPDLLGRDGLARWRRDGVFPFEDGAGRPVPVHWELYESMLRHPQHPEVPCPTRIVHGRRDEVVPIEISRRYAASRPHVDLVELDDDHALTDSIDRIEAEARKWIVGTNDP